MESRFLPKILTAIIVLLLVPCSLCLAQAETLLDQAEDYFDSDQYQQAETICEQIITEYPDSDYALEAQEKLTVLYVHWGKQAQADTAYQQLLSNYSERANIAKAVDHVADAYRNEENYTKAKELYEYAVATWPQAEHAVNSQTALVKLGIAGHEGIDTQEEFDKLTTVFSGYENLAERVDEIADFTTVRLFDLGNAVTI